MVSAHVQIAAPKSLQRATKAKLFHLETMKAKFFAPECIPLMVLVPVICTIGIWTSYRTFRYDPDVETKPWETRKQNHRVARMDKDGNLREARVNPWKEGTEEERQAWLSTSRLWRPFGDAFSGTK